MERWKIYAALLLVFCLSFIIYSSFTDRNQEFELKRGMKIVHGTKQDLISNMKDGSTFMARRSASTPCYVYKIDSYAGDSKYRILQHQIADDSGCMDPMYLFLALGDKIKFKDTLVLDRVELFPIIGGAETFDYASKLEYQKSDGFFDFIDNSIYVVLFLSYLFMVVLLLVELMHRLLRYFGVPNSEIVSKCLWVLGGIAFHMALIVPPSLPRIMAEQFYRPLLLIVPVFLLYQFLLSKKFASMNRADAEAGKFVLIFGGVGLMILVSNFLTKILSSSPEIYKIVPDKLSLGFAFAFALGNLFFNLLRGYMANRRAKKSLNKARKDVEHSQSQLASLQSSVNPHFLYNALNSIAILAKSDPDKTVKMTRALSNFYRYQTNRSEDPMSTIGQEIEMITSYLEIEKIRFEERLSFELEVPKALESRKIPHFIIQPLIENAIKYGFNEERNLMQIRLELNALQNGIEIKVFDSGRKFGNDMSMGYGLKSVSKKLKLMFTDMHELSFVNSPEKHVYIKIFS